MNKIYRFIQVCVSAVVVVIAAMGVLIFWGAISSDARTHMWDNQDEQGGSDEDAKMER